MRAVTLHGLPAPTVDFFFFFLLEEVLRTVLPVPTHSRRRFVVCFGRLMSTRKLAKIRANRDIPPAFRHCQERGLQSTFQ